MKIRDLTDIGPRRASYGRPHAVESERTVTWPWPVVQPLDPAREYVALVSQIPPLRLSLTGRWFRGAQHAKAQLKRTPGVVGFSLLASPLRKRYLPLSVWTDEDALTRFASTGPTPARSTSSGPRWRRPGSSGGPSRGKRDARAGETVCTGCTAYRPPNRKDQRTTRLAPLGLNRSSTGGT